MTPLKILQLEDDPNDGELAAIQLRKLPCAPIISRVATRADFERALTQSWDILLLDFRMPGFDGKAALEMALLRRPETPVLVLSGTVNISQAVEALQAGAVDYISKDQFERLPEAVLRAHRERETKVKLQRAGRLADVGALAGGIVHDVNNAIAPVSLAVSMIEGLTEEDGRILALARHSVDRATEMLKQITTFIRGGGAERRHTALAPLIEELLRLVRRSFPRQIEIRARVAGTLPLVIGNETQLHQVLLNLCINARDALLSGTGVPPASSKSTGETPVPRPLIEIEARDVTLRNHRCCTEPAAAALSGHYVEISVADNGPGMTPEVASRIFEPFFTTKTNGTGFGLWNVLTIVREHRGQIDLKTIPRVGSKFTVYLPVATERSAEPDTTANKDLPRGHGRTVLLVDDELGLLEITRTLLQTYDYKVWAASTEAEAFALFRDEPQIISALVTDVMMPGIGGMALIRQLRAIDPGLKVICVTGANNQTELSEAKPHAILAKPFTPEQLLTTLERVCQT